MKKFNLNLIASLNEKYNPKNIFVYFVEEGFGDEVLNGYAVDYDNKKEYVVILKIRFHQNENEIYFAAMSYDDLDSVSEFIDDHNRK